MEQLGTKEQNMTLVTQKNTANPCKSKACDTS